VDHFALTAGDARADDNLALQRACAGGRLATAQWLVDHFALTVNDARANNNYALRQAKQNSHTAVVEWLENFIGVGLQFGKA
jgi:hypothetical protein